MHQYRRLIGGGLLFAALFAAWRVSAHDEVPIDAQAGERPTTIWRGFSLEPQAYTPEAVRLLEGGVPARYGHEEWAAVVMTHEFHQHVGIYTTLGAKMGVLARELLGAPMRAVRVVSETGRKQPLACTIDGFQASLGSTLGQNLIEVLDTDHPAMAAIFEYRGRTIRLSLKAEYAQKLADIIQDARNRHGDLTPAYFQAIEQATYRVWADFDRRIIFSVDEIPPPPAP